MPDRGARFGRFRADEAGAGTAFSIILLMVAALLGGLVIDINNAWRHKELLKTTADVAVHAGMVELAGGASAEEIRRRALAALEYNTPEADYGRIVADAVRDVVPLHYDSATNRLSATGEINAVSVTVQRSAATGNPVPTYLMRLVGRPGWNITGQAVAALVPSLRCSGGDGIYARGELLLGQPGHVGGGVCLHSQDRVVLAPGMVFEPGAGLSMPDLARCGAACGSGGAAGVTAAAGEANLLLADPAPFIAAVFADFTDPRHAGPLEKAFFADRPLAADLSALDEVGVDIRSLQTGSLVDLSPLAFARLREIPAGLVYRVSCMPGQGGPGQGGLAVDELVLSGGILTEAAPDGMPEDSPGDIPGEGAAEGLVYRDLALMTDCALLIDSTARIEGALVVSTRDTGLGAAAAVRAAEGARIGDPEGRCGAARRSTILTPGDVALNAGVLGVNVGVVTAGDLWIGAGKGESFALQGVGLHAAGMVGLAAAHAFRACGGPAGDFDPALLMIRHVLPGMDPPDAGPEGAPEGTPGGAAPAGGTAMSRRSYGS